MPSSGSFKLHAQCKFSEKPTVIISLNYSPATARLVVGLILEDFN